MITKEELIEKIEKVHEAKMEVWDELAAMVITLGLEDMKEKLAEAYSSNLYTVLYDMACGKASEHDFEFTKHIISQLSKLTDFYYWDEQSTIAYYEASFLYDAKKTVEAENITRKAIELCEAWKQSEPDEEEVYVQITLHFQQAYEFFGKIADWKNAIGTFWEHAQINAFQPRWDIFFTLVFQAEGELLTEQKEQIEKFDTFYAREKINHPSLSIHLASELERIFERNEFSPKVLEFFEKIMEDAVKAPNFEGNYFEVSDIAHFFYKIGIRYERTDFLQKAIDNYARLKGENNHRFYAERNIIQTYFEMGKLSQSSDSFIKNEHINRALELLKEHEAGLMEDFGSQLFMAENLLLLRAYFKEEIPMEWVVKHAQESRIKGEGHYFGPAKVLIEAHLLRSEEDEALCLLFQELLLHELCLNEDFNLLKEIARAGNFLKIRKVIDEYFEFDERVKANYYFDPKHKLTEVMNLPLEELEKAWTERMVEIIARPSE